MLLNLKTGDLLESLKSPSPAMTFRFARMAIKSYSNVVGLFWETEIQSKNAFTVLLQPSVHSAAIASPGQRTWIDNVPKAGEFCEREPNLFMSVLRA